MQEKVLFCWEDILTSTVRCLFLALTTPFRELLIPCKESPIQIFPCNEFLLRTLVDNGYFSQLILSTIGTAIMVLREAIFD